MKQAFPRSIPASLPLTYCLYTHIVHFVLWKRMWYHTDSSAGEAFYQHLVGVQQTVESVTTDKDLSLAGLFHSIYGTEGFSAFTVSLAKRPEIRNLIGERAELICYVNCVMDRASLDATLDNEAGSHFVTARPEAGNHTISLTDQQLDDLVAVHLCDWLQQVNLLFHLPHASLNCTAHTGERLMDTGFTQVEMEAGMTNERHGWTKKGHAWGYRRQAYQKMAQRLGGNYLQLYDEVFAREPEETKGIHQKFTPKLDITQVEVH